MDISKLQAEDLLRDGLLDYKKGMDFFHLQLVDLNVNIFILDHVLSFPFHLFPGPGGSLFFWMVFENFFYASVLIITRVATDQGDDPFTLPRFKNKVRDLIKPEYQADFDNRLRQARFDSNTRALLKKARNLRLERVAHTKQDIALNKTQGTKVVFGEIKALRDQLNSLLDALSFNVQYVKLPPQYDPDVEHPRGTDTRPDIEVILDSIAERSPLLRMPEKDPMSWRCQREHLSERDIQLLNKYRRKFGLPAVQ